MFAERGDTIIVVRKVEQAVFVFVCSGWPKVDH